MKLTLTPLVGAIALLTASACTKQEVAETPKFDAKAIAAAADNGNLAPLKELNAACSAEVATKGSRGTTCATQDEVGSLRKPLKLKF